MYNAVIFAAAVGVQFLQELQLFDSTSNHFVYSN